MQSSLSWIEWLDRLDRVLDDAREDVRALVRQATPLAVAAVERCRRQLSSLTNDLRFLDRRVLAAKPGCPSCDRAEDLQRALDTAVFQLGTVTNPPAIGSAATRERALAAIDSALLDSAHEAAMLLEPNKRRA